jgi:hypothetical protein
MPVNRKKMPAPTERKYRRSNHLRSRKMNERLSGGGFSHLEN